MKRVLVVDDDAAICELFAKFLERDGYVVTTAYDGRSALEQLRANSVDLLILDINMPELGGATLVQLYTGMIYEGPRLAHRVARGLVDLLQRDGFAHLRQAVGRDA